MAKKKFRVLDAIEHDETLYVPEDHPAVPGSEAVLDDDGKVTGHQVRSGGHGGKIAVDRTGAIELTSAEASPLLAQGGQAPNGKWFGVIAPIPDPAPEPKKAKKAEAKSE